MESSRDEVGAGDRLLGGRHQRSLELLALAGEAKRIVMLEGPACSGKTSLVRDLAWLRNVRLLTIAVNAETEVSDLIGGFAPTGSGHGELQVFCLG